MQYLVRGNSNYFVKYFTPISTKKSKVPSTVFFFWGGGGGGCFVLFFFFINMETGVRNIESATKLLKGNIFAQVIFINKNGKFLIFVIKFYQMCLEFFFGNINHKNDSKTCQKMSKQGVSGDGYDNFPWIFLHNSLYLCAKSKHDAEKKNQ